MPSSRAVPFFASQAGWMQGAADVYQVAGGDINFATDLMAFFRFPTELPKSAVINSATLTFNIVAKNDVAQTAALEFAAHASGDSPRLTPGSAEWWRWRTDTWVAHTMQWTNYPPDANGNRMMSINVASILQELVARGDWVSGGYVTLLLYVRDEQGSDMGVRANNDFAPKPQLDVTWSEPWSAGSRWLTQVNLLENNRFDPALDSVAPVQSGSYLPGWYQNPMYGIFAEQANYGVFDRDAAQAVQRVAGRYAARFTVGPPPAENNKSAGVVTQVLVQSDRPTIFNGWLYVPSDVTSQVLVQSAYHAGYYTIAARDQWVPFCTEPIAITDANGWLWLHYAVRITPPVTQGWQIYLSEPGVSYSPFPQMPWSPLAADTSRIDYSTTAGAGRGARRWRPKTVVAGSNRSRWVKDPSGLMLLAETS